jgi:glycosyltransferase involved in cell wall biosynthesis
MKLLFIKAGKALKTLQRDGIIKGGRRVFAAFFAMFGRVRPADVLIITGGVGDSARYRAHHVAEELELNGITASVTIQDNPLLATYSDKFKVFIFHRVLYTPSVQKLIENIKKQKKEIIFETDDLVYDPQYLSHMDYFKQMNLLERKLYENGVGGEILNDPYVKTCTTTTDFLADKLRGQDKRVFIVPNKLCKRDVEIANEISEKLKVKSERKDEVVKIGYFSGTLSHNKDFATVTDALVELMRRHENVELCLVGPLDMDSKLNKYKDRIKQFPYVPREKHFGNVASVDINIAPLEIGNPFCESKSELKYFEASIVCVPSVCAATDPYRKAIEDGVDGFVASGTDEWIQKLEELIENGELRKRMGEGAREKTMARYTTVNAKNGEYYEYLKLKVKG